MTRAAACEHRNTPVRLTRTTRSHSSSVIASVALTTFTPALLIRTSSRPPPKRAACAIPVSTLVAEPTSRPMAQAWPPVAVMPSATDLAEASSTSATITRAPAFAKASAVARPIPRPAPVTRQVRPVTSKRPLMRAAAMIGLAIRGDTGPPVKAAAPEYLAIDRRRMEILERARSGGAAMNSTVALLIVMTITFVFTSFAHSAPGEPRLVQGVLEWPARLTAEPFVVVHTRRDRDREAPGVNSADLGHAREHPGHRGEEPARDQRHRPRLGGCRRPGDGADAARQSDGSRIGSPTSTTELVQICGDGVRPDGEGSDQARGGHGAGAAGQGTPAAGSRRTAASQASV